MNNLRERLRVALLAGTLGQGGAEKQLVYMVRTLQQAGVDVRVYSLTRGEFYEDTLMAMDLHPTWIGKFGNPTLRLADLVRSLQQFRPHIIQSGHFFANLYVALAARLLGAISLGAMRSSLIHSRKANGTWSRWLICAPTALLANSQSGTQEVVGAGIIRRQRVYHIPNVIDLAEFDRGDAPKYSGGTTHREGTTAIFVARLIPIKRLDRFLSALAIAGRQNPNLKGAVVGDGPQREVMEKRAADMGLDHVKFLGQRDDVSALLRQAEMLVLCSDDEGFPNVVLEAMAARLPVITTPAGDAGVVVEDGLTGYVVPFDNVEGIARHLVCLAESPELRHQLGRAARRRVEQHYSLDGMAVRLLSTYREVALGQHNERLLRVLSG